MDDLDDAYYRRRYPLRPACPSCGSHHVLRKGNLPDPSRRRYRCGECGTSFDGDAIDAGTEREARELVRGVTDGNRAEVVGWLRSHASVPGTNPLPKWEGPLWEEGTRPDCSGYADASVRKAAIDDAFSPVVFIDTETTGRGRDAEVLSLAVISRLGDVIYDGMFRPRVHTSWWAAGAINNISPYDVAACPTIDEEASGIYAAFAGASCVVGWNVGYDMRMLRQDGILFDEVPAELDLMPVFCREAHARGLVAERRARMGLSEATALLGIAHDAHTAKGDAEVLVGIYDWVVREQATPRTRIELIDEAIGNIGDRIRALHRISDEAMRAYRSDGKVPMHRQRWDAYRNELAGNVIRREQLLALRRSAAAVPDD